jgi:hypothetical protein
LYVYTHIFVAAARTKEHIELGGMEGELF